jgi:hypothetical protein
MAMPAPSSLHHLRHDEEISSRCGALASTCSAISPSVTLSSRFFKVIGITRVIGSTLPTSTSSAA